MRVLPAPAAAGVMMTAPPRAMAMMMAADMRADADAADVDAQADAGAGGRGAEQGEGKKRSDQDFHGDFLIGLEKGLRQTHAKKRPTTRPHDVGVTLDPFPRRFVRLRTALAVLTGC